MPPPLKTGRDNAGKKRPGQPGFFSPQGHYVVFLRVFLQLKPARYVPQNCEIVPIGAWCRTRQGVRGAGKVSLTQRFAAVVKIRYATALAAD